jgi:hypothetical protein
MSFGQRTNLHAENIWQFPHPEQTRPSPVTAPPAESRKRRNAKAGREGESLGMTEAPM